MKLQVIDTGPLKGRPNKWYKGRSRTVTGICVHHTAVSGGFGPSRSVYRRACKRGGTHRDALILATAARYRRTPYHVIYNPTLGVLFQNLPYELWAKHGNGSNRHTIGFAWDENSLTVGDEYDVSMAQQALRGTIRDAMSHGHLVASVTCHSAWTRKPHDPGPSFFNMVVEPVALELMIDMDYGFSVNGGTPLGAYDR